jgi:hypothetical protein
MKSAAWLIRDHALTMLPAVTSLNALRRVARPSAATVPRRLAEAFASSFGLRVLEPPISIRPYRVSIVWHERKVKSALHNWIIAEVEECALWKSPWRRRAQGTGTDCFDKKE